jgi:hypothetical protein
MLMPKASPDFDDFLCGRKNNIGFAWQRLDVATKFIIQGTNDSTHVSFWLCSDTSDLAHVLTAPFGRDLVCHGSKTMPTRGQTAT